MPDPIAIGPVYDPETDGSPETDDDHDFWTPDGIPIPSAWLAAGLPVPEGNWGNIAETYNYASQTKRAHTAVTTAEMSNAVRCPGCQTMQVADDGNDVCDVCGTPLPDEYVTGTGTVGIESGVATTTVQGINSRVPKDNLIRAITAKGTEWRVTADPLGELYGQFSEYKTWYEVDSVYEGRFMERIMPGAFTETMQNDMSSMRVLLNHGMDMPLGNLPIAELRSLQDGPNGPEYTAPLYDTAFNRDNLLPLLQGKLMDGTQGRSAFGASMRFQVQDDVWNRRAKADKYNPEALPERTITRAKVYEFGPVTFPANGGATASARSMTDQWLGRLVGDREFFDRFADRVGGKVARQFRASIPQRMTLYREPLLRDAHRDALRRRARVALALSR